MHSKYIKNTSHTPQIRWNAFEIQQKHITRTSQMHLAHLEFVEMHSKCNKNTSHTHQIRWNACPRKLTQNTCCDSSTPTQWQMSFPNNSSQTELDSLRKKLETRIVSIRNKNITKHDLWAQHTWTRTSSIWHTSTVWHTGTRYNATTAKCGFTLGAACVCKRGVPAPL